MTCIKIEKNRRHYRRDEIIPGPMNEHKPVMNHKAVRIAATLMSLAEGVEDETLRGQLTEKMSEPKITVQPLFRELVKEMDGKVAKVIRSETEREVFDEEEMRESDLLEFKIRTIVDDDPQKAIEMSRALPEQNRIEILNYIFSECDMLLTDRKLSLSNDDIDVAIRGKEVLWPVLEYIIEQDPYRALEIAESEEDDFIRTYMLIDIAKKLEDGDAKRIRDELRARLSGEDISHNQEYHIMSLLIEDDPELVKEWIMKNIESEDELTYEKKILDWMSEGCMWSHRYEIMHSMQPIEILKGSRTEAARSILMSIWKETGTIYMKFVLIYHFLIDFGREYPDTAMKMINEISAILKDFVDRHPNTHLLDDIDKILDEMYGYLPDEYILKRAEKKIGEDRERYLFYIGKKMENENIILHAAKEIPESQWYEHPEIMVILLKNDPKYAMKIMENVWLLYPLRIPSPEEYENLSIMSGVDFKTLIIKSAKKGLDINPLIDWAIERIRGLKKAMSAPPCELENDDHRPRISPDDEERVISSLIDIFSDTYDFIPDNRKKEYQYTIMTAAWEMVLVEKRRSFITNGPSAFKVSDWTKMILGYLWMMDLIAWSWDKYRKETLNLIDEIVESPHDRIEYFRILAIHKIDEEKTPTELLERALSCSDYILEQTTRSGSKIHTAKEFLDVVPEASIDLVLKEIESHSSEWKNDDENRYLMFLAIYSFLERYMGYCEVGTA